MKAYYNEHDPKAAAWLRELISAGHIAPGDVDERSITDVRADDLMGYSQCHFFAGIGGWSLALRLAGIPDSYPVDTCSCPCQPFSHAGKRKGEGDARHLWPEYFRIARVRRPFLVLGEQVEGAVRLGWLDGVFGDLEGEGYACGAHVLGAHSVGAPHIRQRLYWLAYAGRPGDECRLRPGEAPCQAGGTEGEARERERCGSDARSSGGNGRLANTGRLPEGRAAGTGEAEGGRALGDVAGLRESRRLANGIGAGLEGLTGDGDHGDEPGRIDAEQAGSVAPSGCAGGVEHADLPGEHQRPPGGQQSVRDLGSEGGFWSGFDLISCRDGKARRVESGTFPLAHGVPARVGRLRGYGNAIVPQVAAAFIEEALAAIRGAR